MCKKKNNRRNQSRINVVQYNLCCLETDLRIEAVQVYEVPFVTDRSADKIANGRDESVAHSALSTKATSNPAQRLFTESSSIGLFCHNASPEISDPYYERPRLVASFHEGAPRVNNTPS